MFEKLKTSKIKFFTLSTSDSGMMLFKEFYFGYLLNLLVDKLSFDLNNINLEIVYPYNKYVDYLLNNYQFFEEEYFIFFLENSYHSNQFGLGFLEKFLENANLDNKKIIIFSTKITNDDSKKILSKYKNISLVIKGEIEYFFYKYFYDKTDINLIDNLIYRDINTGNIVFTKESNVNYDLSDYILGGHYSGYLDRFQNSRDYIISFIDKDRENSIYDIRMQFDENAMLSTGRGCKYKCGYCYRGVKYSSVRQIPIDVIKKDLNYLKENYYKRIYLYDDCFITTNYNRVNEIVDLLSNYEFDYGISVRYEIFNDDIFDKILKLNLYRVQIGLQTIGNDGNKIGGRFFNKNKFLSSFYKFKDKGVYTSIDLIIGLPGDTLKDFIKTLNFVISIKPNNIHINTLNISPSTNFYNNINEFGLVLNEKENLFSVPDVVESFSFKRKDIKIARAYVNYIKNKNPDIRIVLR